MHKSLLLAALVFAADTAIKSTAEKKLPYGEEIKKEGSPAALKRLHNRGAVLSSFENKSGKVRRLSVISLAAMAAVYACALFRSKNSALKYGLAMALGGAASNTLDRVKKGYVVDYLEFPGLIKPVSKVLGKEKGLYIGGIVWNVSDFAIISGALIAASGQ